MPFFVFYEHENEGPSFSQADFFNRTQRHKGKKYLTQCCTTAAIPAYRFMAYLQLEAIT